MVKFAGIAGGGLPKTGKGIIMIGTRESYGLSAGEIPGFLAVHGRRDMRESVAAH